MSAPPNEAATRQHFGALLVASALAYGGSVLLAPHAPLEGFWGWLVAFVLVAAVVVLAGVLAPSLRRREWPIALAAGLALVGLALVRDRLPVWLAGGIINFVLVSLGGLVGGAVGGRVDHPGYIVLLAWVAAVVDIASVFAPQGPTAQIVASPEVALPLVTLAWPIFGSAHIDPVIGIGDVAIASVFGGAARRNGLSRTRLGVGLSVGFLGVLAALVVFQRFLPALPMLSAAAVIALAPASLHVPAGDRAKGIGFAAVITIFAVGSLLAR